MQIEKSNNIIKNQPARVICSSQADLYMRFLYEFQVIGEILAFSYQFVHDKKSNSAILFIYTVVVVSFRF